MITTPELLRRADVKRSTFYWLRAKYPERIRPALVINQTCVLWDDTMVEVLIELRRCSASRKPWTKAITAFGRTQTLSAWADETGLQYRTIWHRLTGGWSPEDAVSKPSCRPAMRFP